MQSEILRDGTKLPMQILGVNSATSSSGNDGMVQGRVLSWLQDTAENSVWESWQVTYRDVVVLDSSNRKITAYNLTVHDLHRPAAYDSLLQILLGAADAP